MRNDIAALTPAPAVRPAMSLFERWLTLWVAMCIVAGIAAGALVPELFRSIAPAEVAKVNLPVAVLCWLMITPMLLKIDLANLGHMNVALGGPSARDAAGAMSWNGAAGTMWLVDPARGLNLVLMSQFMPPTVYPIWTEVADAVRKI